MLSLAQQLRGISARKGWPSRMAMKSRLAPCHARLLGLGRTPVAPGLNGRTARRSRLEAVLFLAREPVSLRKLAQLANLADATEARTLLDEARREFPPFQSALAAAVGLPVLGVL
jgi:segregation and condensation protein B